MYSTVCHSFLVPDHYSTKGTLSATSLLFLLPPPSPLSLALFAGIFGGLVGIVVPLGFPVLNRLVGLLWPLHGGKPAGNIVGTVVNNGG